MFWNDHSNFYLFSSFSDTSAENATQAIVDWCVAIGVPSGRMSDCLTHFKNETLRLVSKYLRVLHHFVFFTLRGVMLESSFWVKKSSFCFLFNYFWAPFTSRWMARNFSSSAECNQQRTLLTTAWNSPSQSHHRAAALLAGAYILSRAHICSGSSVGR